MILTAWPFIMTSCIKESLPECTPDDTGIVLKFRYSTGRDTKSDENVEITDPVCKSIIFQSIRSAVGRHSWSIVCAKLCIFFRYVPVYEIVGDTVGCPDYVECFVGIIRIIDDCKVF